MQSATGKIKNAVDIFPHCRYTITVLRRKSAADIEAWLSLVERSVRDAEAASSNLVASIIWEDSIWFYQSGRLVKRLRRSPLTAQSRVRFPDRSRACKTAVLQVLFPENCRCLNQSGRLVKRLRRSPLTAQSRVRFPDRSRYFYQASVAQLVAQRIRNA